MTAKTVLMQLLQFASPSEGRMGKVEWAVLIARLSCLLHHCTSWKVQSDGMACKCVSIQQGMSGR